MIWLLAAALSGVAVAAYGAAQAKQALIEDARTQTRGYF